MKIANPIAFIAFARENLYSDQSFMAIEDTYQTWMELATTTLGMSLNNAREFAFLRTFKDSGVLLYKGTANFDSWQERSLTPNELNVLDNLKCN
jgi:uncharacterized protein with ATP-grasp and redox domains